MAGSNTDIKVGNKVNEIPSTEEWIEILFGGTDANKEGGDYAKQCKDREGRISGIGPECVQDEEEGASDIATCYHDEGLQCIVDYRQKIARCCELMQMAAKGGVTQAEVDECYSEAVISLKGDTRAQGGNENGCIGAIPNTCECKQCLFDIPPPAEEEDEPDEPTVDPDVDDEDPLILRTVRTNSAYGVIPRVFGRYVTAGNIIWVGNQQVTDIEYDQVINNAVETLQATVTKVDFIVALGVGPMHNCLRIWFNDVLIFNAALPLDEDGDVELTDEDSGATDLDLSVLADNDYTQERYLAFKPTVEFLKGGAAQKVMDTYSGDVGFGRAPAHRGITLVMFKDVDVSLFNDTFPDIRFDVFETEPDDVLPNKQGEAIVADEDYLEIDLRTENIVTVGEDEINLYDMNSLALNYTMEYPDAEFAMLLKSSHVMVTDTNEETKIINPYTGRVVHDFADLLYPLGRGSVSTQGYTLDRQQYDLAVVSPGTDGEADIVKLNYNTDVGEYIESLSGETGYTLSDALMVTTATNSYYYQFLAPIGDTDEYLVRRVTLLDANKQYMPETDPDEVAVLDDYVTPFTLDSSIWNDEVDAVITKVIRDLNDNGLILFIDATTPRIVKLAQADLAVVWNTEVDEVPFWGGIGQARADVASDAHYYVIDGDVVVKLTLATGEVEVVDDLSSRLIPNSVGTQFYDPRIKAVMYFNDSNSLGRLFFERLIPRPTSIGAIFKALLTATNVPLYSFDTTDAEEVILEGYYIDTKKSIRDLLVELSDLYQVTFSDNGLKVSVFQNSTLGDIIEIDPLMDVLFNTLRVDREITGKDLDTAAAEFFTIDDTGLVLNRQIVSLRPDRDTLIYAPTIKEFKTDVHDNPERVRNNLERYLLNHIVDGNAIGMNLMPRMLGICPNDRVEVNGVVYRVNATLHSPETHMQLKGSFYKQGEVETTADLIAVPNGAPSVRKPSRLPPFRPVLLYLPALTDADMERVLEAGQVAYTGIEAPTLEIEPTRFQVRFLPKLFEPNIDTSQIEDSGVPFDVPITLPEFTSQAFVTQQHTKTVFGGVLVQAPVNHYPNQFTTDKDSELIIRFDNPAVVDAFVEILGLDTDVQEVPLQNLLIVGNELIQFKDWSVAIDGVTVTFTTLFRGNFGTETYINLHEVGERCYLYTDAFKTVRLDPDFTCRGQVARVFFSNTTLVGVPNVVWNHIADAGSARHWPVTNFKIYDDSGNLGLYFNPRRAFLINFEVGNLLPSDNGEDVMIVQTPTRITLEEFKEQFIYDDNYDEQDIEFNLEYNIEEGFFEGQRTTNFAFINDPNTEASHFVVARVYNTPDGSRIVGHPMFISFDPTPVFPPEPAAL